MYRVASEYTIYTMSPFNSPVLKVENGASLVFETCDCFANQIKTPDTKFETLDWERINPATGPVYVDGAEPGDILVVRIDEIKVASQGTMLTGPQLGTLGDQLRENTIRTIPIREGKAIYENTLKIPLNPMIGVIGTAPAADSVPCGTPGKHGGNMDCKIIKEGTTLYLPVNVPGALLALGDLHAAMGDGEVSVCGLEVPGEVTLTVSILKDQQLPLPFARTEKAIYVIASEKSLDEAVKTATQLMAEFLVSKSSLDIYDAVNLLSLVGNLQICQVVDPLKTIRLELAQSYLDQLGITLG